MASCKPSCPQPALLSRETSGQCRIKGGADWATELSTGAPTILGAPNPKAGEEV